MATKPAQARSKSRLTANNDAFAKAEQAAKFIQKKIKVRPQVAIVLGSGLGSFADDMSDAVRIPYSKIPNFPLSTAIGHAGQLVIGKVGGTPAVVMQGRFHQYEGYSPQTVVFPVRVFARMGVRNTILTNAAGGIKLDYGQGRLVLITDHINLQGNNPLVGSEDVRFGPRFIDMTDAYSSRYREMAHRAAEKLGIKLSEGVYAGLLGPSYETPAEIRFLRTIGADLVGMSTVVEVIAARQLGMNVLAISCVTNMAAGILDQ
ncbi:MAG TPA: purine-nucleoside phosphorylase, partial [Candidatus Limnocylindrales bacterium]|nr:purine-nucleoside phosphorylase [Candidatus Limnocylindrales bacterium]